MWCNCTCLRFENASRTFLCWWRYSWKSTSTNQDPLTMWDTRHGAGCWRIIGPETCGNLKTQLNPQWRLVLVQCCKRKILIRPGKCGRAIGARRVKYTRWTFLKRQPCSRHFARRTVINMPLRGYWALEKQLSIEN